MKTDLGLGLVLITVILVSGVGVPNLVLAGVDETKDTSPWGGPVPGGSDPSYDEVSNATDPATLKGPAREQDYFSRWHTPHGAVLSRDVLEDTWERVQAMPEEERGGTDPWRSLGPYGMDAAGGASRYSGRLLDLDYNSSSLRFASATGGLWEFFSFIPISLTDNLSSQVIGTVATDPNDEDHIFVGTGEGRMRAGTGMFETWDRGEHWQPVELPLAPTHFYRIRYVPGRPQDLVAATSSGVFRSLDNGVTWTHEMTGEAPAITIWPHDPNRMWAGRWGDGIYTSTDAGDSWTKVSAGLPTTNVGRVALTAHPGSLPVVYASIARNDNNGMLGVYRTVNGTTWTNVSPSVDFISPQGHYNNAIAVNPANYQEVLLGGVTCWRTDDAGATWTQVPGSDMHADVHAILWRDDTEVWVGHDGGFCYSNDGGLTWASDIDVLPTVQFYNIDVGLNAPNVMGGGTQDNGVTMTLDGGLWTQEIAQDGSDFVVDVRNPAERMWATWGPRGGDWLFPPTRTTNQGNGQWDVLATGIDPNDQWWTEITHDRVDPVYLYTNARNHVYRSIDGGESWGKFNTTPFPWSVGTFAVSRWQPAEGSMIWAATASGQTHQLWVWNGLAWNDRSAGLPNGRRIRRIATVDFHATDAYVVMQGIVSGQQVFKSTNLGLTWTNVTGDLPAIPVGDIVEHPSDSERLYLGTEMGCYRSSNGGTNWERWNHGMPEANIVTDLATVDSLATVGRFYVVAGTYGRGLWSREVSNDDPVGIADLRDELTSLQLSVPRPNPARDIVTLEFSIRAAATVTLDLHDATGRRIQRLARGPRETGSHRVDVDVTGLTAGAYFVKLESGERSTARRLLVLK